MSLQWIDPWKGIQNREDCRWDERMGRCRYRSNNNMTVVPPFVPLGPPLSVLLSTGVTNFNVILPPGSVDPRYTLTMDAGVIVNQPAPVRAAFPVGNIPNPYPESPSTWIGFTGNKPAGEYRITTTIDLTLIQQNTASLELAVTCDDRVLDILLNGVSLGFDFTGIPANDWSPQFFITQGFIPGINILELRWRNDAGQTGIRASIRGYGQPI